MAWRVELAVLQTIKQNHKDGLPTLEDSRPELPDSRLRPDDTLLLLTQPVVAPLSECCMLSAVQGVGLASYHLW